MFARPTTLRLALAVLALFSQLTLAVALPAAAALRPRTHSGSGCAPASCACAPVEKALTGFCCNAPAVPPPTKKTPPKSCCEAPAEPKPLSSCCESRSLRHYAVEVAKPAPAEPTHTAELAPGGTCRCDKVSGVATAEPAVPPTFAALAVFEHPAPPERVLWATLTATDPLPPPAPPPRV